MRAVGSKHKKTSWQILIIKSVCKPFFAVKYRNAVIGNLINETKCKTIIVNGVEGHVHCFLGLKPVVSVSELMKTVKSKSSKYINDHGLTHECFEWQEAYGVFSYGQPQVDKVYKYILN